MKQLTGKDKYKTVFHSSQVNGTTWNENIVFQMRFPIRETKYYFPREMKRVETYRKKNWKWLDIQNEAVK